MSRNKTYIDPLFWSPEDVIDLVQDVNLDEEYVYSTSGEFSDEGDVEFIDDGDDAPITGLRAAESFTIFSQVIRTSADGKHVVDVVIEVPDYPGVKSYEYKIVQV